MVVDFDFVDCADCLVFCTLFGCCLLTFDYLSVVGLFCLCYCYCALMVVNCWFCFDFGFALGF